MENNGTDTTKEKQHYTVIELWQALRGDPINFWKEAISKWFEWLGWATLLAAIQFVQQKSNNQILYIVLLVSYFLLLQYTHVILVPSIKLIPTGQRLLWRTIVYLIALFVPLLTYLLVGAVIRSLSS